ncbi:matrix-remodeling-associated protein 5 [Alosa alosa]|uniref:matrix-remodeling-associated protein 5 n=1 Tax=Alosa alosa TaxID=278164 RepID=UPI002015047E|nr:matrix-remodeling-associated protein 5 [Alosa alosa]
MMRTGRPADRVQLLLLLAQLVLMLSRPGEACPRPCSCQQPGEVHCTFRSLMAIPAGIPRQVERMNLGFNSISRITDSSLVGLRKLDLLMMHGNDIHNIPDGAFRDLSSLQMLKLSYNKLRELRRATLWGLWSLTRLHLDHNRLETLHPDAFQGLTGLRLLQLEGNRLQQLHPHALCTFSLLGHFPFSTLRHLHLADNALRGVSPELLRGAPLLETLTLHGNPWSCDCGMRWFGAWNQRASGVLKCKKDRAYEGGQLCPLCSSPTSLQQKELQQLDDLTCSAPVIISAQRSSMPEDTDSEVTPPEEFRPALGNVSLGLTDEHGNKVNLECSVREMDGSTRVSWAQLGPGSSSISANVSFSVDLECPMDRGNYERLWRLIAYYSDVPAHLQREVMLEKEPNLSYRYRQDPERDALYFTGVRASVKARPSWVMQPEMDLQLNRRQSSGKLVRLLLSARTTQHLEPKEARDQNRAWVLIQNHNRTRTAVTTVVGQSVVLECSVTSSGDPAVEWVLPDGSRVAAPHRGANGRLAVSESGELSLRAVEHGDAGLYYCVAHVTGDFSVLPFRLVVEESSSPPPGGEGVTAPASGFAADRVLLPCEASGSPDAERHWIMPDGHVVSPHSNATPRALLAANGSLVLPHGQISDNGYYKCVALSAHGVDTLATKLTLSRRQGRPLQRPPVRPQGAKGVSTRVRPKLPQEQTEKREEEEVEGASGEEGVQEEVDLSARRGGEAPSPRRRMMQGGVRGGGGHPSRNSWRRPGMQRKPIRPGSHGAERGSVEPPSQPRRRVGLSNNQIDPERWANILAKVRDRTKGTTPSPPLTTTEPPLTYKATASMTPEPVFTTELPDEQGEEEEEEEESDTDTTPQSEPPMTDSPLDYPEEDQFEETTTPDPITESPTALSTLYTEVQTSEQTTEPPLDLHDPEEENPDFTTEPPLDLHDPEEENPDFTTERTGRDSAGPPLDIHPMQYAEEQTHVIYQISEPDTDTDLREPDFYDWSLFDILCTLRNTCHFTRFRVFYTTPHLVHGSIINTEARQTVLVISTSSTDVAEDLPSVEGDSLGAHVTTDTPLTVAFPATKGRRTHVTQGRRKHTPQDRRTHTHTLTTQARDRHTARAKDTHTPQTRQRQITQGRNRQTAQGKDRVKTQDGHRHTTTQSGQRLSAEGNQKQTTPTGQSTEGQLRHTTHTGQEEQRHTIQTDQRLSTETGQKHTNQTGQKVDTERDQKHKTQTGQDSQRHTTQTDKRLSTETAQKHTTQTGQNGQKHTSKSGQSFSTENDQTRTIQTGQRVNTKDDQKHTTQSGRRVDSEIEERQSTQIGQRVHTEAEERQSTQIGQRVHTEAKERQSTQTGQRHASRGRGRHRTQGRQRVPTLNRQGNRKSSVQDKEEQEVPRMPPQIEGVSSTDKGVRSEHDQGERPLPRGQGERNFEGMTPLQLPRTPPTATSFAVKPYTRLATHPATPHTTTPTPTPSTTLLSSSTLGSITPSSDPDPSSSSSGSDPSPQGRGSRRRGGGGKRKRPGRVRNRPNVSQAPELVRSHAQPITPASSSSSSSSPLAGPTVASKPRIETSGWAKSAAASPSSAIPLTEGQAPSSGRVSHRHNTDSLSSAGKDPASGRDMAEKSSASKPDKEGRYPTTQSPVSQPELEGKGRDPVAQSQASQPAQEGEGRTPHVSTTASRASQDTSSLAASTERLSPLSPESSSPSESSRQEGVTSFHSPAENPLEKTHRTLDKSSMSSHTHIQPSLTHLQTSHTHRKTNHTHTDTSLTHTHTHTQTSDTDTRVDPITADQNPSRGLGQTTINEVDQERRVTMEKPTITRETGTIQAQPKTSSDGHTLSGRTSAAAEQSDPDTDKGRASPPRRVNMAKTLPTTQPSRPSNPNPKHTTSITTTAATPRARPRVPIYPDTSNTRARGGTTDGLNQIQDTLREGAPPLDLPRAQSPNPGQTHTGQTNPGQTHTHTVHSSNPGQTHTDTAHSPNSGQTNPGQTHTHTAHSPNPGQINPGQTHTHTAHSPNSGQTRPGQTRTDTAHSPNPGQTLTHTVHSPNPGQTHTDTAYSPNPALTRPGQTHLHTVHSSNSGQTNPGQTDTHTVHSSNPGQTHTHTVHSSNPGLTDPGQTHMHTVHSSNPVQTNQGQTYINRGRGSSPGQTTQTEYRPYPGQSNVQRERVPSPDQTGIHRDRVPSPDQTGIHRDRVPSPDQTGIHRDKVPSPDRTGRERAPSPEQTGIHRDRVPSPDQTGIHRDRVPSPDQIGIHRDRLSSPERPSLPSGSVLRPDSSPARRTTPVPPTTHVPPTRLVPPPKIPPSGGTAARPQSPDASQPSPAVPTTHEKSPDASQPSPAVPTTHGKPRISSTGVSTVTVPAEADAHLPCVSSGEPRPFLSWTKVSTGASVAQNTRIQRFEVHSNGTLIIRKTLPSDRGQYMCSVQNQYGEDRAVVSLVVLSEHPRVVNPKYRDTTVHIGESVDLECQAKGHPTPRVTWVLPDRGMVHTGALSSAGSNFQRVALFPNGTLRITQSIYTDRGIYKCIASNAAGADSVTVRLHVSALPPTILQGRHDNISLPEGSSAYLHCSAQGTPPPTVRWTSPDNTQLRPSQFVSGRNLFVFPNGTLFVRSLGQADSGRYECAATNTIGAAWRAISLVVIPAIASLRAHITFSSPQNTQVGYGAQLRLDCIAAGNPEPRIIWRTPSKKLVDTQYSYDPRLNVFPNGTLVLQPMTEKDEGDYLCVARNKMGDDYILLRVAVVTKPAKIMQKSSLSQEVTYGSDLRVDCVALGLPNPKIQWALPDGTMINSIMTFNPSASGPGRSRRYVVFDNGTLFFNDVGMREEGDYTCYADNQVGKDEMKVRVKVVSDAPIIRNQTQGPVRVLYGEAASLRCEAKGEPVPTILWFSPASRIIPTSSDKYRIHSDGTLVIQKVQRLDGGNYTCLARNSAGQARQVTRLEILVSPPTINGLRGGATSALVRGVTDQRKLLDCVATGMPVPRITWVLPNNVILPAPYYGSRMTVHRNGTLEIRGLKRSDAAQLACVAQNEGGEARLQVLLEVQDPEERPPPPPPPQQRPALPSTPLQIPKTDTRPLTIGAPILLNCSLAGSPPAPLTWVLPNGSPLASGARYSRFYHRPDGMLLISNPTLSESGVYRCVGRSSAATGTLVERSVALVPERPPEISSRYSAPISVLVGASLQLHCQARQGVAPVRLSWKLPTGVVMTQSQRAGRYNVLPNGTLSISQASVHDRGSYVCHVANEYGSATLTVPVIIITYAPRITSGPTLTTQARRGVAVQLNCAATGLPRPEIAWETPDRTRLVVSPQPRLFGNKYLHPQGALIIQNPSPSDSGFYRCTARNVIGVDSKGTYLRVL